MTTLYLYKKENGFYAGSLSGDIDAIVNSIEPDFDYTLMPTPPTQNENSRQRWVDTKWVELLPINNSNIPYGDEYEWNEEQNQWVISPELDAYKYLENQDKLWELIKERRLQAVTSGVYVESVDKWFHTDEVSVTSYSTIAGMMALDNYEPVQWKTMDNTWILLTIPIFKELQTAMSQKTNANYVIAEQHKSDMMKSDNPLEYDFSTGWV